MSRLLRRWERGAETAADRARRFRWRIRLLYGAFILGFVALGVQALVLMALPSDERLKRLTERQHSQVVTLYPTRGVIYDRNGVELALSVETDSIYADPKYVVDAAGVAQALAPLLKLPVREIQEKLERPMRFVWLARRIGPGEASAIKALKLPGINSITETRRFYPNRELAGALLGFTNIDNEGLEGLERTYEDTLNGSVVRYVRLRDAKGRNIHPEGVLVRQNQDGGDVHLTIDRNLQYVAEQALNRSFVEFNARGGFVVVMDPRTGELLALANAPGYNPNIYSDYGPAAYKNQAAVNVFEPGSTQKVFLMAAAFNDRVARPDETVDCENGRYKIGRNTINDTHPHGVLSMQEVLKYSSNIGCAKLGERLGKQRIYDYYRAFGFGESTRSGLTGEAGGILRHPKRWSRIGLATHAFGQGMSVTGLQIASALGALANDGLRMRPHIVRQTTDQDGNVVQSYAPQELGRVVSPEVAATLREFMRGVTEEGGTGTRAAIDGYSVAGKTGTAQKVDPVLRRYAPGVYVSSFVGMVPAESPRLIIVAVLDEPRGSYYYGGTVSGPIFAEIARAGMRAFGVPPTVVENAVPGAAPSTRPTLVSRITRKADAGPEADQDIPAFKPVTQADGEVSESYILPDFTGQTMRRVLSAVNDKPFALQIRGSGVVVSQTPAPGETIRGGEALQVVFSHDGAQKRRVARR